jgi:general secretion pathway protein L
MNYLIVQLTGNEAVIARFQHKRGALVFAGASRDTVDEEHPLAAMLAAAAADAREEERVILALPPGLLFLREMELPIRDRRKLRELLPLELKGETAIDSADLAFDALPLEEGSILAIWGKRDGLAEKIALMADRAMEPEIVTASLFHWHSLLPEGENRGLVAITDGESLAVYRDGTPCYFRALGPVELETELARTLAALEISKGMAVEKVYLHGAAARRTGTTAGSRKVAVLTITGEIATVFGDDITAARDLAGAYAVAHACCLEEPVNLRSGALAYTTGQTKALKRLRLSLVLAAACVGLLFAETGVRYFLVKRDLDSVNSSIRTIYREVFPNRKKPVDEVSELRSEIKRLGGGAAGGSVLAMLNKLATAKGDDVTGLYEIEVEGDQLRVKGDARSIQAVNDFRTRTAALFTGAEVGEIKSRPDGGVSFVFRATAKEGVK